MKRIIYGYFYDESNEMCMVQGQESDVEIKWINKKQALIIDGEKIFIDHRKTVEIPTCPRCGSENIHIWKRKPYKNNDSDSTTFFNFECWDCGLERTVKADSAYFRRLIDTDKEDQAEYLVGLLNKQGNAFISKWILDLFGDKDILEKWLCDETGLNVVLREANDPEIKAEGHMIAEVKKS